MKVKGLPPTLVMLPVPLCTKTAKPEVHMPKVIAGGLYIAVHRLATKGTVCALG